MGGGPGCAINGVCGLKPALAGALRAFLDHLDGYSLADLVNERWPMLRRLAPEGASVRTQ
jgi:Rrf2 family nitric oxide-sensitive transcriptional repressor